MDGYGRAQYSNDDIYIGYFKRGDMSGLGLYYQASSDSITLGLFEANQLQTLVQKFEKTDIDTLDFSKPEY